MLIVAGGGPSGTAAAYAAAKLGGRPLLIERYGFLGGMGTAALVQPWMSFLAGDKNLAGGFFNELVQEMTAQGAVKRSSHLGMTHFCFDPEILKYLLQEKLLQAGVKILFHTMIDGVTLEEGKIKALQISSKSGREELAGDFFVDATGDGDLFFFSGCPYEKEQLQPMTLHFTLGGVAISRMPSREEINMIYKEAKAKGEIDTPKDDLLWFDTLFPDQIHFNTTRVQADGTDKEALTRAEIEGKRQMMKTFAWVKSALPGFEQAYLIHSAPQIGVRETRRLKGKYRLTGKDIRDCRLFPHRIALGAYGIDVHSSDDGSTHQERLKSGSFYSIPFECLIPEHPVDNLLVAGRCLSADREAFSAVRIQPTCYSLGQAAGVGAALSLRQGKIPERLEVSEIQAALREQGAILD